MCMCVDACADMRVDVCVDMYVETGVDIRIDMRMYSCGMYRHGPI